MIEVGERQAAQATDADIARITPMFLSLMAAPEMAELAVRSAATGVPVPTDTNRLLGEIQIWRKLLLDYSIPPGTDAVYGGTERETGFRLALSFALKAKAAVYSAHPDYPAASAAGTTLAGTAAP